MTTPREEDRQPETYPRNLERERRHGSSGTPPPGPARSVEGDGEMVRHEPAAVRGGDGHSPVTHEHEHPHGHPHDESHRHTHAHDGGDGAAHHHPGDGHAQTGDGERLIRPNESDDLRRRWESIQASFIDSPREAVEEADHLVGELTDRIAERFRSERSGLEERWGRGDEASTEELRLTLQRYRGFFDRLLHL